MNLLLRLDKVACVRGDNMLFRNLSLSLSRGEALWLRGPNGTGKSSLIRVTAGLLRPFAGEVHRHGRIALIDEASALDPERPLRQALDLWGRIDGIDGTATASAMEAMSLTNLADIPVSMLSTGQRKRAAMARVIASSAPIWLLDEPANGMDDAATRLLADAITAHLAGGGCALIASHFSLGLQDLPELDVGDYR
jgi:heme exporter protein A